MSGESPSIEIRAARLGEEEAILAMYEWLFEPPGSRPAGWDPRKGMVAIVDAIVGGGSTIIVAVEQGRLVGLASCYLDLHSVRFGTRCWVEDLAVDPERRSRGIGRRLLAAAREWGRAHGATHLELDSGEARGDAHRFYERERPSWRGMQYAWKLEP